MIDVLERLRQLGVSLSIDDFRRRLRRHSYLQRLPVQEVKIDQMFVRQARGSDKAQEIITSIIQLRQPPARASYHRRGRRGRRHAATSPTLGCPAAPQGYHFSRPLPLIGFIDWLWQRSAPAS